MKHRVRWLVFLAIVVLGVGIGASAALARPGPPPGRVLYVRLRLTPYGKEIQYWIDAAHGRLRYAETMSQTSVGGRSAPSTWYVITLRLRPDGQCAVTSTTLLDGSEREDPFSCAGLLALRSVSGLRAQALALRRRYGAPATATGRIMRVPVPAGTDLVTPIVDHWNMKFGYETMAPGVLVLDRASGRPLSISGYRRDSATMTEQILEARDLPPGTLPDGFFDAPAFSLPDRAPLLYRWLHDHLPWHP